MFILFTVYNENSTTPPQPTVYRVYDPYLRCNSHFFLQCDPQSRRPRVSNGAARVTPLPTSTSTSTSTTSTTTTTARETRSPNPFLITRSSNNMSNGQPNPIQIHRNMILRDQRPSTSRTPRVNIIHRATKPTLKVYTT